MDLSTILKAAASIGPDLIKLAEVRTLIDQAIAALHPTDQATAREGLADVMAENDEGHARLQAKLKAAAK